MKTETLLRRVNEQPVLTVHRAVGVPGAQLRALLAEGRPIMLAELMAHPDQHQEFRTFHYGHLLGPGLHLDAISAWEAAHPAHLLPQDLREFLTQVDGVHLWADLASSRAYFGILPLAEWQDAGQVIWAGMFASPPERQLVISYHANGDSYLVLDTNGPGYLWYDLHDFDNPRHVGRTVAELLDFWWKETAWLDPRHDDKAE